MRAKCARFALWCAVGTDYLSGVDTQWFKARMKAAGATTWGLGEVIGRDRSVISKLANGAQRMSLEQARLLAQALDVPLSEMVERAGIAGAATAQQLSPGFAETDVAPYIGQGGGDERNKAIARALGADRPGVDIWSVRTSAMALGGILPGDHILVDTSAADRCGPGDAVIAQVYSRTDATTVLRRFEAPVLVAASADPADQRVHVVDGVNVVIRGRVIAVWRA